jgi:hypothetical protein
MKKQFARNQHAFIYHIMNAVTGKTKVNRAKARVVLPTKPVTLTLTEDHIRKSIDLHGAGRTDACAGAICALDHAETFPHQVEGHVDFQYSRLFVVSKVDAMDLPKECYCYEHDFGNNAKLNDSKNGQEKLLAMVQEKGPIVIKLTPYRQRSEPGRPGKKRPPSGVRDPLLRAKGAKLRYAVIQQGGYPVPGSL